MVALRWGIASAGKISHDFCVALSTLPKEEHQVVAVAARQKERAEEFARKFDIKKFYGSYAKLAQNTDVDIVYIGALNPQHFELAKLMLDHGKHVLCEKPLCMNLKQAEQLLAHAKSKQLFLMEAVWSRFFPAYQYVRQQIDAGNLGEIKQVDVTFGFPLNETDRLQKKDLGGGVILDLGVYTIQCSLWGFRGEAPTKISAHGELNADGVDIAVEAELHFAADRIAKMHFSAKGELENRAVFKGTKGQITLIGFWCPTKLIDVDGTEKEWPLPQGRYPTNFKNSEGLRYEAEAVRQDILAGNLCNSNVTHDDSRLIASIQDALRKQIGVVYEADEE